MLLGHLFGATVLRLPGGVDAFAVGVNQQRQFTCKSKWLHVPATNAITKGPVPPERGFCAFLGIAGPPKPPPRTPAFRTMRRAAASVAAAYDPGPDDDLFDQGADHLACRAAPAASISCKLDSRPLIHRLIVRRQRGLDLLGNGGDLASGSAVLEAVYGVGPY